jgi:alanyl-tRNA synthetase
MEDGTFEKLAQRNVEFGGGLERITAASINNRDVFQIDVFQEMFKALRLEPSFLETAEGVRKVRIILDHIRAGIFLIGDGVMPSNKGQGYVLRRLLRRAALFSQELSSDTTWIGAMVASVIASYKDAYQNLEGDSHKILTAIKEEFKKFNDALQEGLREFDKRVSEGNITGKDAFDLYQSYGFPWEMTEEIAKNKGLTVDRAAFEAEFVKHRDLSRTASAGTFKGGLADTSEKTTRLHTTHHLLLKALQMVLGPEVKQRGSNITSERLRLDFSYDKKMTDEEKKRVEDIVNEKIKEDLPVIHSEMPRDDAEKLGAEHEFGQKYPERVSIYSVGPKTATLENPQFEQVYSIEFCGGPHVMHTGEIGGKFKLAKEEASSAGVRRIRGVIE